MSDQTVDGTERRRMLGTRRIAAGAVVGALAALLLAITLGGGGDGSDTGLLAGGSGEPDDAATSSAPTPLEAPPGTCLTWTAVDASDARRVDCSAPHLFEVTGTVDLADDVVRDAGFPSDATWRTLVSQRCTPPTAEYLDGRFDPYGRFSVGAIKPSAESWRRGDRELRCGLQTVGRSGALFATIGPAGGQDQSDVHEPGTCLGNDGVGVGDPVDCGAPHAVEVVGIVDLGAAFPDGYPDEAAQDELLSEECTRLAAEYAGGPEVVAEKGLTVFWETLRVESWDAGSRRVDCRLGAFLPDRSGFAPVTGSVRGEVTIGTEPAPPVEPIRGPVPTTVTPVPPALPPDAPDAEAPPESEAPAPEPPG